MRALTDKECSQSITTQQETRDHPALYIFIHTLKVYCLPHLYFFIPKIVVVFRTDLHKMKIKHPIIGEYAMKR